MKSKERYIVVPGVHKGGTTSLYQYLSAHPTIYAPLIKELHHFTPIVYGKETTNQIEYLKHFKDANEEQYRLDISPSYLYGGSDLIEELSGIGEIKVVLLLRKPAQRFISFYKQGISLGFIPDTESIETYFEKSKEQFAQFLKTKKQEDTFYNRSLREGCYSLYIEDWINAFGDNLQITYFEDFISSPRTCMESMCEFLEIDNIYADYSFTVENKSFKPKSQSLSKFATSVFSKGERFFRKNQKIKQALKRLYLSINKTNYKKVNDDFVKDLEAFYAPFNQELEILLKKHKINLPKWK